MVKVTQGNELIRKVFGSLLWTYTDGSPLTHTVREMVSRSKRCGINNYAVKLCFLKLVKPNRVVIENNRDCWLSPAVGQPLVFYPTVPTPSH